MYVCCCSIAVLVTHVCPHSRQLPREVTSYPVSLPFNTMLCTYILPYFHFHIPYLSILPPFGHIRTHHNLPAHPAPNNQYQSIFFNFHIPHHPHHPPASHMASPRTILSVCQCVIIPCFSLSACSRTGSLHSTIPVHTSLPSSAQCSLRPGPS